MFSHIGALCSSIFGQHLANFIDFGFELILLFFVVHVVAPVGHVLSGQTFRYKIDLRFESALLVNLPLYLLYFLFFVHATRQPIYFLLHCLVLSLLSY